MRLQPHSQESVVHESNRKPGSGPTRETIVAALEFLSEELRQQEIKAEICLFGGIVMVFAFVPRVSTKDVDAVFQPSPAVRQAAVRIADKFELPSDWLNEGVEGFLSAKHRVTTGNLPQFANLRLTMPVPEYLLAMK